MKMAKRAPRMTLTARHARMAVAGIAVLVLVASAAGRADAYRLGGQKWPGHRITYHNTYRGDAKIVRAAVRAWNHSGVHLRFVAASRKRAEVTIHEMPRHFLPSVNVPGFGNVNPDPDGQATLGYVPNGAPVSPSPNRFSHGATVWLHPRNTARALDTPAAIRVAAHELGHVLGLNHARHTCAVMDSDAGSQECAPHPWDGPCHILSPDDIRGAIARYGGHLRKPGPAICPVAVLPLTPTDVTAAVAQDASGNQAVTLSWTNSPGVSLPDFKPYDPLMIGGRPTVGEYVVIGRLGACPPPNANPASDADALDIAQAGKPSSTTVYADSPGHWCFSIRDQDDFQRDGPAATVWVNVPAPAGG